VSLVCSTQVPIHDSEPGTVIAHALSSIPYAQLLNAATKAVITVSAAQQEQHTMLLALLRSLKCVLPDSMRLLPGLCLATSVSESFDTDCVHTATGDAARVGS
jgi:hypothetical protein